MGISPNLKFSDPASFRLFTEGVRALQSYEQNASRESLELAGKTLQECVSKHRKDVLPRLYLGIVKMLHGYPGLDEAVTLLRGVVDSGVPELASTAKYNLAEAYVARYTPQDIQNADHILEEVISDAGANSSDRLRAEGLRTFTYVRQHLWENRFGSTDVSSQEAQAKARLKRFKEDAESPSVPDDLRRALLPEYWNTIGLLEEYRAFRAPAGSKRDEHVQKSIAAFDTALGYSGNWVDAKSNKARVYQDLKKDHLTAEHLWYEVLEVREDFYAHYMLGKIYQSEQPDRAISHYSKAAQDIPGAALRLGQCYEQSGEIDNAIEAYKLVPESDKYFEEAKKAIQSLQAKA